MRVTSIALLLPALAAAQQIPFGDQLKGWFEKAKSFVPGSPTGPIDAGAAKVAAKNVVVLTKDNWSSVLTPKPGEPPKEWMILVSGGNKTCYGQCEAVERAWNESAALLSADPNSPSLGYFDCDQEALLCSTWAAAPPSVWHFGLPAPSAANPSRETTPLHITGLNTTTVTAKDITQIYTKQEWKDVSRYEGAFHPLDGWLAKVGLLVPLGYVIWVFGIVPSWVLMISISFLSRSFMTRRMQQPQRSAPAGGAPAAN